ncbi:MAG: DNA (cytosine-5-)-methyltransferase [Firmicutes bacterium]|nr:DNA (cytosine-5-)-methyltransferase [Bacillota bacterium]
MNQVVLTHLSLCTGIGGIDLAAERAGFTTIGQSEVDEYACKVLAKNFKGVKNYGDIRTVKGFRLAVDGFYPGDITVISAGFPCQPYSLAGKGKGDGDERDLWGEVARVIGELRPRWFVGENVPGLLTRANSRYFRRILADLTQMGYSVSWGVWGACDVGAPHKRERVFIVAHTDGRASRPGIKSFTTKTQIIKPCSDDTNHGEVPDTVIERCQADDVQRGEFKECVRPQNKRRVQTCGSESCGVCARSSDGFMDDSTCKRHKPSDEEIQSRRNSSELSSWWQVEPDVGRVANGISARVDRLRCLGNAVVPEQIYPIFKVIAEIERGKTNVFN